ncbi:hypothetical protein LOK49_LG02G03826 [Camellia lanceoleosa]|uniref:Uncharacterized protein n=1 Tax=Camellia lanceoleosa TaxID=1840588 RepID=A0ACC0ITH3_9ERIC|nr:hypothetical protein LOK49_LG02G03826 [Camellia lanceoleosa]
MQDISPLRLFFLQTREEESTTSGPLAWHVFKRKLVYALLEPQIAMRIVENINTNEGIRFRNLSIPACQKKLPAAKPGGEPLPEGLLWLLLTGKVPNKEQVDALSKELRSHRATVPDHVYKAIDALPFSAHPMTQFAMGVMALQSE